MSKNKNQLSDEQTRKLLVAAAVLAIGVLLCCSLEFGSRGLDWLMGLSISASGVILIINSIIKNVGIANARGFIGALLIGVGVAFISSRAASEIINFIPWCVIAAGATLIIDAFLIKFIRKTMSTVKFILEITFGALIVALGICLKVIEEVSVYTAVILGAFLIVCSILMVVGALKQKTSVSSKKDIDE